MNTIQPGGPHVPRSGVPSGHVPPTGAPKEKPPVDAPESAAPAFEPEDAVRKTSTSPDDAFRPQDAVQASGTQASPHVAPELSANEAAKQRDALLGYFLGPDEQHKVSGMSDQAKKDYLAATFARMGLDLPHGANARSSSVYDTHETPPPQPAPEPQAPASGGMSTEELLNYLGPGAYQQYTIEQDQSKRLAMWNRALTLVPPEKKDQLGGGGALPNPGPSDPNAPLDPNVLHPSDFQPPKAPDFDINKPWVDQMEGLLAFTMGKNSLFAMRMMSDAAKADMFRNGMIELSQKLSTRFEKILTALHEMSMAILRNLRA